MQITCYYTCEVWVMIPSWSQGQRTGAQWVALSLHSHTYLYDQLMVNKFAHECAISE